MGRLTEIEKVVNSTPNHYSHVKVFPRGLPSFLDPLLRGTIRFGKRTGNTVALINPDNTFSLMAAPLSRASQIFLANETPWVNQDCIVSMGPGKELHEVHDVIDNMIVLKSELQRDYTTQDRVLLHSFPMLIAVAPVPGDTTIIVKSHYNLGNGDVIAYLQTDGLLQSLSETRANQVTYLGTTTDTFYTRLYRIQLDTPVNRTIVSNTIIYVRAYPGYFSQGIKVPNALFTSEPIGPFLLDSLSGRLLEGKNFKETLAIKTIGRSGVYILGTTNEYQTIAKNYVVIDRPWTAHYPMFWQLAEGTMRLTPSRVIMKVNSKKQFCVGTKCIPNLPAQGTQWRISLIPNDDCTIRFIFSPNAAQEFSLMSGITSNIIVAIPTGAPITHIEVNILSTAAVAEVRMSDWSPLSNTVETIEYSLVVEATGQATYQSTGAILKPYFLGSEFLRSSWDTGSIYDGGKVWG